MTPRKKKPVELTINAFLRPSERNRLLHSIDDRQFLALAQVLSEEIEDIQRQVENPENAKDHGVLAHYSGALAEARYILARFVGLRQEGSHTTDEVEED